MERLTRKLKSKIDRDFWKFKSFEVVGHAILTVDNDSGGRVRLKELTTMELSMASISIDLICDARFSFICSKPASFKVIKHVFGQRSYFGTGHSDLNERKPDWVFFSWIWQY